MAILLKTTSVRVSSIEIMQVRVQNKGKSVWKSRYDGDVSIAESSWLIDTTKIVAGADDTSVGDATELKWEFYEDLGGYYVSFPDDQ